MDEQRPDDAAVESGGMERWLVILAVVFGLVIAAGGAWIVTGRLLAGSGSASTGAISKARGASSVAEGARRRSACRSSSWYRWE